MRTQSAVTIRLYPAQTRAVSAIAEREGKRPSQVLREAVDLRLQVENQAQLLTDEVRRATDDALAKFRFEARALIQEQIAAAMAADATNRSLISAFLEAISAQVSPPPATPRADPSVKRGVLPRRTDV